MLDPTAPDESSQQAAAKHQRRGRLGNNGNVRIAGYPETSIVIFCTQTVIPILIWAPFVNTINVSANAIRVFNPLVSAITLAVMIPGQAQVPLSHRREEELRSGIACPIDETIAARAQGVGGGQARAGVQPIDHFHCL